MASNLRAITDAVTGLSVSYTAEAGGTVTPTALDINQIPASVPAADVPIRLVGITTEGGNSDALSFIAVTDNVLYEHTITELALIESVGLSRMSDELPDQQRYSDAILGTLASNRGIYTNSEVVEALATRTVTEYPEGTEEFWFAVITEITVHEYA